VLGARNSFRPHFDAARQPAALLIRLESIQSLALGLVFAIPGAAIVVLEARNLWLGLASRHWPATQARILGRGSEPGSTRPHDSGITISYAYTVAGQGFTGTRYDYGGAGSGSRLGHALAAYEPDQVVAAYYDPGTPQRAVLRRGVTWGTYARLAVGLGFLGLAFLFSGGGVTG
jgi:hypothetical protein